MVESRFRFPSMISRLEEEDTEDSLEDVDWVDMVVEEVVVLSGLIR